MLDLQKLKDLESKATKGKYEVDEDTVSVNINSLMETGDVYFIADDFFTREDADFIVALRNSFGQLVSEIERLQAMCLKQAVVLGEMQTQLKQAEALRCPHTIG